MTSKLTNLAIAVLITATANAQQVHMQQVFNDAAAQAKVMLQNVPTARNGNNELVTPRTFENGKLKLVSSKDWTSGFFAGELWFLYTYTKDNFWKVKADSFTTLLDKEKFNAGTHDMGFKMYCSYGTGYSITKNEAYKAVIIQSAKTLTKRFNKTIGSIKSWDNGKAEWQYPVIIDNMMNLELLFAATRLTGDSSYYSIAVTHANTTMKNHFRKDYSTYHVVDYDTATGQVRNKVTAQGYADGSAWARGQAWGLYGFTMCYRETKDKRYLDQADSIAAFIMKHPNLPSDGVPYWDYNDPSIPNTSRDASAAAIAASALYELSGYSKMKKTYLAFADKLLQSLTTNYRSAVGDNKGFILMHSTGHRPAKSEIDVPINYADYYYLEALLRSSKR